MEREREGGDWRAHGGGGARMFVLPALPLAPWERRKRTQHEAGEEEAARCMQAALSLTHPDICSLNKTTRCRRDKHLRDLLRPSFEVTVTASTSVVVEKSRHNGP